MKVKEYTQEVICFALMLWFFYEGLYLLVRVGSFDLWLKHLPIMGDVHRLMSYLIPCMEMVIAVLIILPGTRNTGLLSGLIVCVCVVAYLVFTLTFTDVFFLPFHPYWIFMKWFDKMLITLAVMWAIFFLILANNRGSKSKRIQTVT